MQPFSIEVGHIRDRARSSLEDGAVTEAYRADRTAVIDVLNQALATELVCVLRYRYHYYMAKGMASESVRKEFLEHAQDEQDHADRIAARIVQLNGKPELDPSRLKERSHAQYVEGDGLTAMITEDLVAERIAIETYTAILNWLGSDDPTTSRLIRDILEREEEHAEDMASLLDKG